MDDNQIILEKEIDLIQSCITRMGQNSFTVKGWLIGLLIAGIALFAEEISRDALYVIIAGISVLFWWLDGFFLKVEKLYRWKYDWVIVNRLKTKDYNYNLDPYEKAMWLPNKNTKARKEPWVITIMFTKTLIPFYLPIIAVALYLLFK